MKLLKERIKKFSKEEIVKKLGYNSKKRGLKTLEKCLSCKTLYEWQEIGIYDLKYTSIDFYKELCKILNINKKIIEENVKNSNIIIEELNKINKSYIFINTDFERTNENIINLIMMKSKRNINIKKEELILKNRKEILNLIKIKILEHYKKYNGKLPFWGTILSYTFILNKDKYIFNTKGKIIEDNIMRNFF